MRRVWLALLLCVSARSGGRLDDPEYLRDLVAFNQAYCQFFRAMLGCPKGATAVDDCNPRVGGIDYAAYMRAAKLAGRVFAQ